MKKNKNFNLNTNSISSLISDLENLSKNIDDMSKQITDDVSKLGFNKLCSEYGHRVKDANIIDINVIREPTSNGYRIMSQGRDVIYEEFGTGDKGEQSPHPDKSKYNLNDYNSGSFILDVDDAHNQDYLGILAQNGITSGKYWIYRKGGKKHLTQGVPAGMEMYKTGKYLRNEGVSRIMKKKASDVLSKV